MTERNNTKFTPGPWNTATVIRNGKIYSAVIDGHLERLCTMPDYGAEAQANAVLMSYAPEMYENESRNLEMLVFMRDRYEDLLRVITQDPDARAVVELANIGAAHLAKLVDIINQLSECIKQTEKLLAKARGEER